MKNNGKVQHELFSLTKICYNTKDLGEIYEKTNNHKIWRNDNQKR